MKPAADIVAQLVDRFRAAKRVKVPGYNQFTWEGDTPTAVIVGRENGNSARVSRSILAKAVDAVRKDPAVYDAGPQRLREHGITRVTSPAWAILHLCELSEITK